MALSKEDIISAVESMTVIQLNELVEALKEKFGVTGVAVAAAPAGGGAPAAEEKTEFDVILLDGGANKIAVIKEVKAITELGLKEAKELVDNPGKPIKEKVKKEVAAEIKAKIEAAGGKVEIK